MKEDNIDKLMDSAFAKDADRIQKLDSKPDQTLLSSFHSQSSAGNSSAGSAGKFFSSGGLMKLGLIIFSMSAAFVAYLLFTEPSPTYQSPQNVIVSSPTDSLERQMIDTPIHDIIITAKKNAIEKSNTDTTEISKTFHPSDFIPANSTKLKSDSTIKFEMKK